MLIASLEGLPTTTPSPHNDQVMAMNEPHQEDENSLGQASVKDISGAGVVDQTTDGTTGKSINRMAANEIHGDLSLLKLMHGLVLLRCLLKQSITI